GESWPANELRKEYLRGRRDRRRLNLAFPAQTVTENQVAPDLPFILHEHGRLQLRNGLGAGIVYRFPANARELQKQQQRTCDLGASGTDSEVVRGVVRAFDKRWSDIDVVHKTRDAIEDITSVREADEGLGSAGAVEFEPYFEI